MKRENYIKNGIRKKIKYISALMCCMLAFAGCSSSETAGENTEEKENILVIADTQCPTSLDPAESWNSWYTSRWGITETLFKLDGEL